MVRMAGRNDDGMSPWTESIEFTTPLGESEEPEEELPIPKKWLQVGTRCLIELGCAFDWFVRVPCWDGADPWVRVGESCVQPFHPNVLPSPSRPDPTPLLPRRRYHALTSTPSPPRPTPAPSLPRPPPAPSLPRPLPAPSHLTPSPCTLSLHTARLPRHRETSHGGEALWPRGLLQRPHRGPWPPRARHQARLHRNRRAT